MIVLDTTVLVYAVGSDHALRKPCQSLVAAIEGGQIAATTSIEVIQEFAHVRARRRDRSDAAALARAYVDLLSPLLVIEEGDLLEGLRLFERYPDIGPFDAVLVGAAQAVGATALVSADAGFAAISGLRHVFPSSDGVASLTVTE